MSDNLDPNIFDPNFQFNYEPQLDSTFNPLPPKMGRHYTWLEAWKEAILRPSVETYQSLVADPQGTFSRSIIWLVATLIFSMVAQLVAQLIFGTLAGGFFNFQNQYQSQSATDTLLGGIFGALCCYPIMAGITIVLLFIVFGIIHLVTQVLGGRNTFEKTFYALSLVIAPSFVISGFLSFIPLLGICLGIFLQLYFLILMVIAIKATHRFGWLEASISTLSPLIITLLLVVGCVGLILVAAAGS